MVDLPRDPLPIWWRAGLGNASLLDHARYQVVASTEILGGTYRATRANTGETADAGRRLHSTSIDRQG